MLRNPHISTPAVLPSLVKLFVALICALLFVFGADAAAAQAGPVYRGAQVHSLWYTVSNAEMTQELNALQGAGVNVLRVDVGWASLEPAQGHYEPYYLAKLDALSAGAAARGIKLIATLWQTPHWASSGGAWNDAPSNPAYYGAFAKFITSRYGSELAAVEAWNEPEIDENLVAPNVAEAYVQMVKAFYAGAKEGDPSVPVLAGALAYADIPFLRELYADGIKGYYDGISVHPYSDGAAPANTSVTHSFLGGIESLHAAQQAAGDDAPEWITEFGWTTGTSQGASTEQQQAEYTEQAFALLDKLPYVEGATVYELRDMETNPSDPEDNFGLLRQNFEPTPAYAALKAAMQIPPGSGTGPSEPPLQSGSPETGSGSTESGGGPTVPNGQEAGPGSTGTPEVGSDGSGRPESGSGDSGASESGPNGSGTPSGQTGTQSPEAGSIPGSSEGGSVSSGSPNSGSSGSGSGPSQPGSGSNVPHTGPSQGGVDSHNHRTHARRNRRARVASLRSRRLRYLSERS